MAHDSRLLLPLAALVAALGCAALQEDARSEEEIRATAREIHQRVITIDTHADIPLNFATPEVDPGGRGDRQVDIPKMIEGGLDAAFFIVYVGQTGRTFESYARARADALTKFEAIRRMTETYPDRIELATSPEEIEHIHARGRLVACIGIENGSVIGTEIGLLRRYYDLGARYFGLVHNGHNDIADSATPRPALGDEEEEHGGLSDFGRRVVRELNRLGMMVDVSHASKQAMLDTLRASRAPVIASHSSTRALADVPRNLDDQQLLALRANGGVMQTVALGAFVKPDPPEKAEAVRTLRQEFGVTSSESVRELPRDRRREYDRRLARIHRTWPRPTVRDFVDHIDYAVRLIGVDHVGISSDFDGGGGVEGWNDASETFNVTIELVRRGYGEDDIRKIWGGNLLRVWREVERVAREMQREFT